MKYKLFDTALACNARFDILSIVSDDDHGLDEWLLEYEQGNCESTNINVGVDHDGRIIVKLYTYAEYIIDFHARKITAIAPSTTYIEATIFNIPMAVVALLKQNFPLHGSAINYNGNVMAFCGEKGTGKSTLVYNLLKKNNCLDKNIDFFTDDALLIKACDLGWDAYSCGEYMKLITEEISVGENEVFPVMPNTMYKSYLRQLRSKDHGELKKIFFLKRSYGKVFSLTPITSRFEKILNLYNNLIGVDYYSAVHELTKATIEKYSNSIHKVKMYKVELPSSIGFYNNALEDFLKEILA